MQYSKCSHFTAFFTKMLVGGKTSAQYAMNDLSTTLGAIHKRRPQDFAIF